MAGSDHHGDGRARFSSTIKLNKVGRTEPMSKTSGITRDYISSPRISMGRDGRPRPAAVMSLQTQFDRL
eukprot:1334503-Amorphochlora_amoeboformis.AAC.2